MADLKAKARELLELKEDHARKKAASEAATREFREAEADFWNELDEELGVKTVTLELGPPHGTVTLGRRETIKGRVIDEDKAIPALRAMGLGDAVLKATPQIRQKVLNEHVRDILKSATGKLPEGVDFAKTRYIQVTKKGS